MFPKYFSTTELQTSLSEVQNDVEMETLKITPKAKKYVMKSNINLRMYTLTSPVLPIMDPKSGLIRGAFFWAGHEPTKINTDMRVYTLSTTLALYMLNKLEKGHVISVDGLLIRDNKIHGKLQTRANYFKKLTDIHEAKELEQ